MAQDPIVIGPWTGGIMSNRAIIKMAVTAEGTQCRLAFSADRNGGGALVDPTTVAPISIKATFDMDIVTFILNGLKKPGTEYFYVPIVGGQELKSKQGRFTTFPGEDSPASFRFACAGDADSGSNADVFSHILKENPLFFCHLGDLHYKDTNKKEPAAYRENYREVFGQNRQAELYRNVPIIYMWDDHDFCGESSHSSSLGRLAALLSYNQCVPHYIEQSSADTPAFQSFTVGRVRFLVTDTRSERTTKVNADNGQKTVLGKVQKDWLKTELIDSKKRHPLVVWINSIPWIGAKQDGKDFWAGYTTERNELGGFIENEGIRNVCMLSADMHRLAIDDGTNNRGTTGRGGFPVFQAAPLDKGLFNRKKKGGPYSHGDAGGNHQYGIVTVQDDGGKTVTVTLQGKHKGAPIDDVNSFTFTSPRTDL